MKKIYVLLFPILFLHVITHAQVRFNEIQSSNRTTIQSDLGNYADWIELFNTSTSTLNLSGYYVTDSRSNPRKWQIPNGTSISGRGYLLLWCDGFDVGRHTNFRLSASEGEWILLYSPTMLLIDSVKIPPIATDYSYGRVTDGTGNWGLLASPTPGAQNVSQVIKGPAPRPTFSIPGGFYATNQQVSLSTSLSGAVIRYTTDGSEPTASSPIYTGSISTQKATRTTWKFGYNRDNNTGIKRYGWPVSLTYPTDYYNGTREHAAVIKAKVFHPEYSPSYTAGATYFINMRKPNLPVVSLTTDRADFFDRNQGIYIQGTNGATKVFQNQNLTANWWQDEWERQVFFEYFDANGQRQIGVNAGVQVLGGVSRNVDMKSLRFNFRNAYGDASLDFPIFGTEGLDSYTTFVLRNSGNDWESGNMARDAIIQSIVRGQIDLETQAYNPVIFYINGEYFGLINMRERFNADYIAGYHPHVNPSNVDILKIDGDNRTFEATSGTLDRYTEVIAFMNAYSMTNATHYEHVKNNYIDIDNIINYYIAQIYAQNTDWPQNNVRMWRERVPNGKFRFLLYDLDFGYGLWGGDAWENNLSRAMSSSQDQAWSTVMFRGLMQNEQFRNEFIQRFAYMINTTYSQQRLESVANGIESTISSERSLSDQEWTRAVGGSWGAPHATSDMISWGNARRSHVRSHINSQFNSRGWADLTVNYTASQGQVYLCGLPVQAGYTGQQYRSTPIRLTAEPKDGYRFVRWQSGGTTLSTEPEYFATITANYSITAEFTSRATHTNLFINEIMASNSTTISNDLGKYRDWIEIYNAGSTPVDLAGLYISDNATNPKKFMIPYGSPDKTTVPAGGFLIFWADNEAHEGANHLGFRLSKSGGVVILSQANTSGATQILNQLTYGIQNTDISYGRYPDGSSNLIIFNVPTPGTTNTVQSTAFINNLIITEFMAKNGSTITEPTGRYADWIEIYNNNPTPVDIGGLFMTNDLNNPNMYMIPKTDPSRTTIPAYSYYILWADKQPYIYENHLDFNLRAEYGDIAIIQLRGATNFIIDQVSYTNQGEDVSFGRFPNITSPFRYLPTPTPGAANSNNITIAEKNNITINEILAANTAVVQDEFGNYPDFIEFYNSSTQAVDLGGLFISDNLDYSLRHKISRSNPGITTVQPGEWITFWADGNPELGPLHLDFSLDMILGEEVVLSQVTENGIRQLDYIAFGPQTPNISYGRSPETSSYWEFMTPTYNAQNISTASSTDLASLTSSLGTISPQFSSNVFNYVCLLPLGTTTVPTISASPFNSNASVTITQASSLSGQASIQVISANGNNTATYYVSFEIAPSNDATLQQLAVSYGSMSPAFSPSTSIYTINLQAPIIPLVTAIPNQANALVNIAYANDVNENTVITVTAEAGNTNTYILVYTVASHTLYTWIDNFEDNSVSRFSVTGTSANYYTFTGENESVIITQAPNKPTWRNFTYNLPTGYVINMDDNPNPVLKLELHASAAGNLRVDLIDINGDDGNTGTITQTITAGANTLIFDYSSGATNIDKSRIAGLRFFFDAESSPTTEKTFTISSLQMGIELSSNANLASLTANTGTLSPGFNANTLNYTLTIPHGTTTIPTISATKADANAILEISQASSVNGQAIVRVTAEDVSTVKTYTINFVRQLQVVQGYTENIVKPGLDGFSVANNTYTFSYGGGSLSIDYYRDGTSGNNGFTYNISEADAKILDVSSHPFVALRVRTTTPIQTRVDLFDGNGRVSNANPTVLTISGSAYTTYIFDFTNKFNQVSPTATVNASDIRGVNIYFDRGSTTPNSGTVIFDRLLFGNHVEYTPNQPPVISAIPNQSRMQGQSFSTILLNNFVTDDSTPAQSIIWTTTGGSNISVSISPTNVATVTSGNPDWIGTETITFIAQDADGATSTRNVSFTVTELRVDIESLSFTQSSINLAQGQSADLSTYLTINPSNATIESIVWSNNNPHASITAAGVITHSLEFGSQTVTATVTVTDKSANQYIRTINVVITGCPTQLTSVSLTPNPATVTEGQTLQLTPLYTPSNACIQTVSYSSNNTSVATVSQAGLVSGISNGTAVITISVNDGFSLRTNTRTVTVEKDCSGDIHLSLNKQNTDIIIGFTETLTSSILPNDECTANNIVSWTSLDPSIAQVNQDGIVSALGLGTARIVAHTTGNGITADTCIVNVLADCFYGEVSVSITPQSNPMYRNSTYTISYSVLPLNACITNIIWTSRNPSIASVSNGIVESHEYGDTYIIARSVQSPEIADSILISVIERMPTSITLQPSTSVHIDNSIELLATVLPSNADDKTVIWSSSDETIASVSQTGVVTGISEGVVTIHVVSTRNASAFNECVVTVMPVDAQSISLNETELYLDVYDISTLSVAFTPVNTTDKTISWSTTNSNVATVENGSITAVGVGTATIRATAHNGLFDDCVITVSDILPTDISVISELNIRHTESETISVTFIPSNTTATSLVWTSLTPSIVTVNQSGTITGAAVGTGSVQVQTSNGITKTISVTVAPIHPESISLNTSAVTLSVDQTQQLVAEVLPINASDKTVTWNSSAESIASVSVNGLVTAHSDGTATITASTVNGILVECEITVLPTIISVTDVVLNQKTIEIFISETASLLAEVLPIDASNKTIVWSSENTNIAIVNQSGHITPVSVGETKIIATAANGVADTCIITIHHTPLIGISLQTPSISLDQNQERDLQQYLILEPTLACIESVVWSTTSEHVTITEEGVIRNNLDFGTETITVTVTVTDKYNTVLTDNISVIITGCNVQLTTVNIQPLSVSIIEGETAQLIPVYSPSNACIKSTQYSSSNDLIATINQDGLITAHASGQATITLVVDDGFSTKSTTRTVTVQKDCSGSITLSLSQSEYTLTLGDSFTLIPLFSPDDECTQNKAVTWTSSAPAIASVVNGIVTAHQIGDVTITATTDGPGITTAQCAVSITPDCFAGDVTITANRDTLTLFRNTTGTILASLSPTSACNTGIVWESANNAIATVSNGVVNGIEFGQTYVVCSSVQTPGAKDTIIVIVAERMPTSITLPDTRTITMGQSITLTPTILPTNADDKTVTWTSSNSNIASVSPEGIVFGEYVGTATITATTSNNLPASTIVTVNPVDALSIDLSETSLSLFVDEQHSLTATILPENTYDKTITWTSTQSAVASVVNGVITAHTPGTTTIRAISHNGLTVECDVTVAHILPESIIITAVLDSMNVSTTQTLSVEFSPANTTNTSITWSSSNTSVLSINSFGQVTAQNPGTVIITATTVNGKSNTITIVVRPISAQSVSLNTNTIQIQTTESQQLIATVLPHNTTNKTITWTSSNPEIASVNSSGLVTGNSVGDVVITATTSNGISTSCNVNVRLFTVAVQSVTMSTNTLNLFVSQDQQIFANVLPSNATNKTLVWTSDRISVATVSQNGTITAQTVGTAKIIATASNGIADTCIVTVLPILAETIEINHSNILLGIGESQQVFAHITPENTTNKSVVWSTKNSDIATVQNNGTVLGISEGSTYIYATSSNNLIDSCEVTVQLIAVPADSIQLSIMKNNIEIDEKISVVVTFFPSNTTNRSVTYMSVDPSIITVNEIGMLTGISMGTTTIRAISANNKISEIQVSVTELEATGISFQASELYLNPFETFVLEATILPIKTSNKTLTWVSANEDVASVNEHGIVSTIGAGTTIISATTTNGLTAYCTIVVTDIFPQTISIEESISSITINESVQLSVVYTPTQTTARDVQWISSDPSIASFTEDGILTAHREGIVTITVRSAAYPTVFYSREVRVTIINNPPFVYNIPEQIIDKGQAFSPINLHDYFIDDNTLPQNMLWAADAGGNIQLEITSGGIATAIITNPAWTGSETITIIATDEHGLSSSYDVIFTVRGGTYTSALTGTIVQAYPNPSFGLFTVRIAHQTPDAVIITLISQNGEIVYKNSTHIVSEDQYTIDAGSFAKGVYTLTISNSKESISIPIIIQ